MFLLNSRPHLFRCGHALLRGEPYPEVTVAFLPSSLVISCLDCLGILYQPTGVRSRYGLKYVKLEVFLDTQTAVVMSYC